MSAWVVLGLAAAVFCLASAAWLHRTRTTHVYPALTAGQSRVARLVLALGAATALAGAVWALASLDEETSTVPAVDLVLVGCTLRRGVLVWRQSHARMIWSDSAEHQL